MTNTSKHARIASSSGRMSNKAAANRAGLATGADSQPAAPVAAPRAPSKQQQQLVALVVRDEGATLEQMIAATGWLPHTTRAALTGLKYKGYVLSSDKVDGVRTYRAVAPE